MLTKIQLSNVMLHRFLAAPGMLIVAEMLSTGTFVGAADGVADSERNEQIDWLVEAWTAQTEFVEIASDSEFLRHVYLDLAGRIPSAEEARPFPYVC